MWLEKNYELLWWECRFRKDFSFKSLHLTLSSSPLWHVAFVYLLEMWKFRLRNPFGPKIANTFSKFNCNARRRGDRPDFWQAVPDPDARQRTDDHLQKPSCWLPSNRNWWRRIISKKFFVIPVIWIQSVINIPTHCNALHVLNTYEIKW